MTNRISVKAMLFDLDGTLIDSKKDLASSINLMLGDFGRPPLAEDTIASFVGDGVRVLVRRSLTATHPEGLSPDPELHGKAIAVMLDHYSRQMLETTRLFPDVAETLSFFSSKQMAIVTSKEVRFASIILEQLEIARFFDCIVGGDTVPARKPDPQPVLEAIRLLGGKPEDAVMVGDSENDIAAGRNAGARTCGVSFGFRTAEQLRLVEPEVLIDRLSQLKEFFT